MNGENRKRNNMEIIEGMPPEHPVDYRVVHTRQLGRLSVQERTQLKRCENMIERSLNSFVELGKALSIIKNQRLYRAEFPTFRAYMTSRWSFKASRARQLIAAASVYEDVHTVTDVPPANEAQLRPLVPLDSDTRREVWRKAVEDYGSPTEETVRQVMTEVVQMEQPTEQRIADKRMLWQEVCSRIDECTRWLNRHSNPEDEPEEARRYFQRLLGAVRDWLKY